MKSLRSFSYDEYIAILEKYRETIKSPSDIFSNDFFTLIRHDVEFSVVRAYKMALVEANLNISSTYFFQAISNAYNITSQENKRMIKDIREMGHNVGLHLYISHIKNNDWDNAIKELNSQKEILEKVTEEKATSFAFHRPPKWVLENRNDIIEGLINVYGETFFEFSPDPSKIKYLADSMHRWNFGHPLDEHKFKKFQINTHPDEWTEKGFDEFENFKLLIEENNAEFINTIDSECNHFYFYLKKFHTIK